jgi:ATP-binding cassette subfamily B protein
MINGQKVVKVFCYEEQAKKNFDKVNDELFENMFSANKYANILMPVMMILGNLQYVLVAIVGGLLAVNGISAITVGTIAAFLQLTRNFNQPIARISQQINSVIVALAGASRIFELMDEKSEEDNGKITLVNAKVLEDKKVIETDEKTNKWAWKIPKEKGKYEYVELKGCVEFRNVVFAYGEKIVLHDISLYAKPGQKIAFVGST